MSKNNDSHDKSRDQYLSHKLYLERRHGNRYYNLGYMMYEGMLVKDPPTITVNSDNLKNSIVNFNIALLFNQNDVDAEARKKDLCNKWGPNGTKQNIFSQLDLNSWKNEARNEFKKCKC